MPINMISGKKYKNNPKLTELLKRLPRLKMFPFRGPPTFADKTSATGLFIPYDDCTAEFFRIL